MFLYDGDHKEYAHYRALPFFMDCLDDIFIYIVDDWNWECVRSPTLASIKDMKMEVLWEKEIRLTLDGSHTPDPKLAKSTWHNGIYVCLLQQRKQLEKLSL